MKMDDTDQWRPLEERRDDQTYAFVQYLWGARHRDDLARRDRVVGAGTTLNETRYVLMDYFSPAAITDASGAVTERYAFGAFGCRTIMAPDFSHITSSECDFDFAFQGQFLDGESGMLNYGYRYYAPGLGRWISKDPIGEVGGTNLYAGMQNSCVNKVDHLGLDVAPLPKQVPPIPHDMTPDGVPYPRGIPGYPILPGGKGHVCVMVCANMILAPLQAGKHCPPVSVCGRGRGKNVGEAQIAASEDYNSEKQAHLNNLPKCCKFSSMGLPVMRLCGEQEPLHPPSVFPPNSVA